MDKTVEIGLITSIHVRRGRPHYHVRLHSGRTLTVREPQISPRPQTELAVGDALAVTRQGGKVIHARVPPAAVAAQDTPSLPEKTEPGSSPVYAVSDSERIAAQLQDAEPRIPWPEPKAPGNGVTPTDDDLDSPIACSELEPIFAPEGPLADLLGDRYCPRPGQIQMANLVRDALQLGQHAFVEAGTGIGKSFAYLIPVIWSGTKAIVSTSNKALMEQLWTKDIPQLRQIAPRSFTTALLKGRSNYLCALRLEALLQKRSLPGYETRIDLVRRKLAEVPSGDCEQMRLPPKLWQELAADRQTCQGRKCPRFARCFYERAKDQARAADLVVTNHALLCLNVLVGENKILPVRPVLVIDEAHELERYAIGALTRELVHGGLPAVIHHDITRRLIDEDEQRAAEECNQAFFQALYRLQPHSRSQDPPQTWVIQDEIQEGLALYQTLQGLCNKLAGYTPQPEEEGPLASLKWLAQELVSAAYYLGHREAADAVRFCSLSPGAAIASENLQAHYAPLDVSGLLQTALFEGWPRVICTSATLSVGQNLSWFKQRVGAPRDKQSQDAIIGSPFDYERNAMIYVPRNLAPRYGQDETGYEEQLFRIIQRLVNCSRGRAFLLFTSRRRMNRAYERLSPAWDYPCFCQDRDLSRMAMIDRFKATEHAVLFGTRSFWAGVDIPGEALSLVVLDKIPFQPRNDPVVSKKIDWLNSQTGKGFEAVQLGPAILTLRQGLGRLIRSESDRGVMAILDARALDHNHYGLKIWQSLPPARQTRDLDDIERFFANAAALADPPKQIENPFESHA